MVHGSMTEAARRLNVSQPGVSRLIAELERSTQLKLFERFPGRIQPTEEGIALFREVERVFSGLDKLVQAARNIRFFGSGRLRVASLPALALGFLPRVIRRFSESYPEVTISLHARSSSTVREWAMAQQCDVALAANVGELRGVEVQTFLEAPGVCVLPKGHRLAARSLITPEDLEGESFISLALEDATRHVIDRVFDEAGVARIMRIETQYGATICALVSQGLGVSVVNPIVAPEYAHTGIIIRRFEPSVTFRSMLLYPNERPRNRLVAAFVDFMRQCRDEELAAVQELLAAAPDGHTSLA
jgi:DNA-binding transcriptional LysR family regulator